MGISVLDNILRILDDHGAVPVGDWQYTTFNQRFVDECAGVFVTVGIEVPVNGLCADLFTDFNNDFNDDFAINGVQVY